MYAENSSFQYDAMPMSEEQLFREYSFLMLIQFLNSQLCDGRISQREFSGIAAAGCDILSPMYREVRSALLDLYPSQSVYGHTSLERSVASLEENHQTADGG